MEKTLTVSNPTIDTINMRRAVRKYKKEKPDNQKLRFSRTVIAVTYVTHSHIGHRDQVTAITEVPDATASRTTFAARCSGGSY